MALFDDRKKGQENKYAHDQEMRFRTTARRNKLLGLWLAEQMGKSGADAEAYAKEVITADFERPGDDDVVEKCMRDIAAANLHIDEHKLRRQMETFEAQARVQLQTE